MKRQFIFIALVLTGFVFAQAQTPAPEKEKAKKEKKQKGGKAVVLATTNDSISYSLGVILAENFRTQKMDGLDMNIIYEALKAGYTGQPTLLNSDQANTCLQDMSKRKMAEEDNERAKVAAANKAVADAWLKENGKRPGVITLPSGLQYEIITPGPEGPKPTIKSQVTCHYRGTLIDGTEFDSSYKTGNPATFPLENVIKGWQEGCGLMTPGAKYKFYVPAELGWGAQGAQGGAVPPNAVSIFEIEMISFQ